MAGARSIDQLVDELLATGAMNADTVADLEGFRAQAAVDALEPDDLAYLEALHERILGTPIAATEDEPAGADPLQEALARADAAEAEVARLTALLKANGIEP